MQKHLLIVLSLFVFSISTNAQVLGTPIVTWDFANGLPANWQSGIISTTNIAHWEYRGPSTTPNSSIGARGSCSGTASVMNSATRANGFMIFDSNYWDDGDMTCGGLGSGVDPAPHNAWLITNSINLSSVPNVVLTFQQQYKHYQTTVTKVEVSVNQGEWVQVVINTLAQSGNVEWKTENISALAGGQADVRLKFSFVGVYYWWLIDDITLYTPNQNDVMLNWKGYTTNPLGLAALPYSDLQYDQYPSIMIPAFSLRANATNVGANTQTNVQLNARIVKNGVQQMLNTSSAGISMNPNTSSTLIITPNYNNPAQIGDYKIYYDILQTQIDDNPANDRDSLDYSITPYTYARDEGAMFNHYEPSGIYTQWPYEIGNMFQIRASGKYCHSLQVAIAEGTQVGAQIRGYIYEENMESLVAQTNIYTVNVADLNSVGEEKIVTLHFATPVPVFNTLYYMAMVAQLDATQTVKIARNGNSPSETSYVRFPAVNGNFYSTTTPIVRMNIFNAGVISGCMDNTASNYSPNATANDGSCLYPGCTDENATNYSPTANFDNGTCVVEGCTNPLADNYNPNATIDDGSCIFYGCTDEDADNYDSMANIDDGSCLFSGCMNPLATNYDPLANVDDGSCIILGCMDVNADNYNPLANQDDGSCIYLGCTDQSAVNYDPNANSNDGSCIYLTVSMAVSADSGCAPFSIVITNQTLISDGGLCTFTVDDEVIYEACSPSFMYTFPSEGVFELKYTYQLDTAVSDTIVYITVYPAPQSPSVSYDANEYKVICADCGTDAIQWYYNNTVVEDETTMTMDILHEGVYRNGYYHLTVTNQDECSANSDSVFVVQPSFVLSAVEGCDPLEVEITNTTDPVSDIDYSLNFGDGVTDGNFFDTASHTYLSANPFNITLTATSPLGSGTYISPVIVHPTIVPVLIHVPEDGLVVCQNCNEFEAVVWNIDGIIFNDFGPHSDGAENYTVTGTTEFGCEGSSSLLPLSVVDNRLGKSGFVLYPNPANDFVIISNSFLYPYDVEIFDMTGHNVFQSRFQGSREFIDTSVLSSGVYYVRLISNGIASTAKLTIAR